MFRLIKERSTNRSIPTGLCFIHFIKILPYLLLSFIPILCVFWVSWKRIYYPYELEWTEGSTIDAIQWILGGNSLYSEPSISFIAPIYHPLYYYLSAAISMLFGVGFLVPRLISLISFVGSLFLLYKIVNQKTSTRIAGLLAAGLYSASFRFTGAWIDLAKTDSLWIFFILLGYYFYIKRSEFRWHLLGFVFFGFAVSTKQTALPVLVILSLISAIKRDKKQVMVWILFFFMSGLGYLWLDFSTHGWFSFYTFETLRSHPYSGNPGFFWIRLLEKVWPICLILTGWFFTQKSDLRDQNLGDDHHEKFSFPVEFPLALIVSGWITFSKVWTYDNGFMPVMVGMSLSLGFGFEGLNRVIRGIRSLSNRLLWNTVLFLLLITQFFLFRYNLMDQIPSLADRDARSAFISLIRSLPGKTLIFHHGFINTQAGKEPNFHSSALGDTTAWPIPSRSMEVLDKQRSIQEMFNNILEYQYFDRIVTSGDPGFWEPYYIPGVLDPVHFYPVTGAADMTENILQKNPIATGGRFPLNDPVFNPYFDGDWGLVEQQGRTIEGSDASLKLILLPNTSYRLNIQVYKECKPLPTIQRVQIFWDDHPMNNVLVESCQTMYFTFFLPNNWVDKGFHELSFTIGMNSESKTDKIGITVIEFMKEE